VTLLGEPRRIAVALLAVLAVSTGCGSSDASSDLPAQVSDQRSTGFSGAVIERPYPLPEQRFTDTAGRPFVPDKDAKARVTLVFFGYTHCPDVCNTVLANVAAALRRTDGKVREGTQLLFITTDPERDTPEVIRGYLDRFDPSYVGLTASLETVKAAAASMHIAYAGKEATTGGGYEVSHGTQVTAFDHHGEALVVWMADTPVRDLRADLTRLAGPAG
jgi:protein SCO1